MKRIIDLREEKGMIGIGQNIKYILSKEQFKQLCEIDRATDGQITENLVKSKSSVVVK